LAPGGIRLNEWTTIVRYRIGYVTSLTIVQRYYGIKYVWYAR
jgi:hypothetical protein